MTHVNEGDAPLIEDEAAPLIQGESAEEFVGDESLASVDIADSSPVKPPGPGLIEACFWWVGFHLLSVAAWVVVGVLLSVLFLFTLQDFEVMSEMMDFIRDPELLRNNKLWNETISSIMGPLLTASQLVMCLLAVVLCKWRLQGEWRSRLGVTGIHWQHLLLLCLTVMPMIVFSQQVYIFADGYWAQLIDRVPQLRAFEQFDTMDKLPSFAPLSAWTLVFCFAVVPAISEEFVFRGVIGRGLTARWGLPLGIVLTSLLFCAAHQHPVHAASLIPFALIVHFAYWATRSFWAPVFLHFANNGIAVAGLKYNETLEATVKKPVEQVSPILVAISATYLLLVVWAYWKTRVKYLRDDGAIWSPEHANFENPTAEVGARREFRRLSAGMLIGLTVGWFVFFGVSSWAVS